MTVAGKVACMPDVRRASDQRSLSGDAIRELTEAGARAEALVLRLVGRAFDAAARIKRERYHRVLPLADYLVGRWDKARFLGFGEGTSIYDSSLVLGDVRVGRHCWIGPFTVLDGSGGLVVGDHCTLSAGVHVYTHDSIGVTLERGPIERAPVRLGDHVYLGPNVVVAKGVTIGDYAVIGANSFVNTDIPARSKAAGNPARVLGSV